MSRKYHRDPRITSDRTPPSWFLDELKGIDECLKVEWWNEHPVKGPSYRLVRVVPDGRYAEIDWFQYEDEMRLLVKWLKANDTHKKNRGQIEVYNETLQSLRDEVVRERVKLDLRNEGHGEDFIESVFRHKDRMYSIPGVTVRRDWTRD